jgi:hypothetical protein
MCVVVVFSHYVVHGFTYLAYRHVSWCDRHCISYLHPVSVVATHSLVRIYG